MGGVAVANGSTLSATGEMQVSCNVPYTLSVDGVEWVPTTSSDGVDTYLLSTGGVVRIFINGSRYFYFVNNVVPQFSQDYLSIRFTEGNTLISSATREDGLYFQEVMPSNANRVQLFVPKNRITPSMTSEELLALGATCIQGEVSAEIIWEDAWIEVTLTNFDNTSYNAVFLGNVLLAFLEPAV